MGINRIVFLLEEYSMQVFLEEFIPRRFPGANFVCISHEGKSDLERSIPRKLRAWREPGVRFVVIRDNDRGDCRALKRRLTELCRENGREDVLIRIAVEELEAWYIGDPEALAEAFGDDRLAELGRKAGFRNPDAVSYPSQALQRLIPEFQKVSGARRMGKCMGARDARDNRSRSFGFFLEGLRRLFLSSPG